MLLRAPSGELRRTVDAESEALSLTDVKSALRITEDGDNDFLRLTITAVRKATEEYLGRTLIKSTWTYQLDKFPADAGIICLPMGPVKSITSLQYYDDDDAQQTWGASNYEFDESGRIRPVSTVVWPSTYDRLNAVTITYVAGEDHAGKVDEEIRQAMRLLVGHYEQNRENTSFVPALSIPLGYLFLLNPYRNIGA